MNVVELFCCSGGMAEGLRRAGLPVTEAFDFDDDACASYERNLGHKPIGIDVRDLLRMVRLGWRPSEMRDEDTGELRGIDLLVADPPCVSWSRAGKRLGLNDPVDMLKETVAIVAALAPRHFLIANVPGLDDGPNWPVVQELIGGLSRHGYCIDFARLDACDYGCPVAVRPALFMCREHWFSLRKPLRDAIHREYRRGQEKTKRPTVRYLAVQQWAIAESAFRPLDERAAAVAAPYFFKAQLLRALAIETGAGDPLEGITTTAAPDLDTIDPDIARHARAVGARLGAGPS